MNKIEIPYDFNGYLRHGYDNPVPLSAIDYIIDSTGSEVLLSENMDICIFEIDYDALGNQDNLYADGIVTSNPKFNGVEIDDVLRDFLSHFKWWFQINKYGIRHESDRNKIVAERQR